MNENNMDRQVASSAEVARIIMPAEFGLGMAMSVSSHAWSA
jgi:hypothetical protein